MENTDFTVSQGDEVLGILAEGRSFRSKEGLVLADADDHRRSIASNDDFSRLGFVDDS